MRRYRVTAFGGITLPAGVILRMPEEQVARRAHLLSPSKRGLYEALQPVQFKRGEMFATDEDMPKALLEDIAELDEKRWAAERAEREKAMRAAQDEADRLAAEQAAAKAKAEAEAAEAKAKADAEAAAAAKAAEEAVRKAAGGGQS